jgi:hypothetical protein
VKIIDLYGDQFNPVLGMPDIAHQFMGQTMPDDVKIPRYDYMGRPFDGSISNVVGTNACYVKRIY